MSASQHSLERSLFWPILLIGLGLIWLMMSVGMVAASIWSLLQLWPLLLIAVGLELLFGRDNPRASVMIAGGTVLLMLLFMMLGSNLGGIGAEARSERFKEPLGSATSASVNLSLGAYTSEIRALTGDNLLEATVHHQGNVRFSATGTSHKNLSLRYESRRGFMAFTNPSPWTIGLHPQLPLDLSVQKGSGRTLLDLRGLTLSSVSLSGGSGASEVILPSGSYQAELRSGSGNRNVRVLQGANLELSAQQGSGSLNLTIEEGSSVQARLATGSGSINIHVPAGAAVRLEVQSRGSGRVDVLLDRVLQVRDEGRRGMWETQDFESAEQRIHVIVTGMGSGNLTIR